MESEARRLCDMGREFLDRGEPEEALRCYERAIDVDPENPDAWCGRGKAAYNLGLAKFYARDFAGSVNAFRRAFFANLHLPPLLCERPPRPEEEIGASEGPVEGPRSRSKVHDDDSGHGRDSGHGMDSGHGRDD